MTNPMLAAGKKRVCDVVSHPHVSDRRSRFASQKKNTFFFLRIGIDTGWPIASEKKVLCFDGRRIFIAERGPEERVPPTLVKVAIERLAERREPSGTLATMS